MWITIAGIKNIVDRNFTPIDGEVILQFPLTNMNEKDNLCWVATKNGDYTVRTGYYMIKNWQKDQSVGVSEQDCEYWAKIWKVQATPRQQFLIWRIVHKILPVREELNRRGVRCNLLCPRCEESIETINHCFKEHNYFKEHN